MRVFTALPLFVSSFAIYAGPCLAQNAGEPAAVRARGAQGLIDAGEYTKAEASLRSLLRDFPGDTDRVLTTKLALADLLREEARGTEARDLFEQVRETPRLTQRQRMIVVSGLADIDCNQGRMDASLAEWTETLALAREAKDTSSEASALRGLAIAWLTQSQPSRAEPLLRRALKLLDDHPPAHLWETASALTAMGECYRAEGKFALAEEAFSRALDLDRSSLGEGHPQVAFVMEHLAVVYASLKQFGPAHDYSARAESIMRAACGADSTGTAGAVAIEGEVEERANHLPAAAEKYGLALGIVRKHPGSRSFELRLMEAYAGVLRAIHRSREAKELDAEIKSLLRSPA